MKNVHYDILQFSWDKDTNCFYADAWDLVANMPDGSIHPEAFPTMRGEFFVYNYKTNGFRRFRFVKEVTGHLCGWDSIEWIFESEDGIECRIAIS